ncbi:hypothetical protein CDAR_559431 [Caerostris darwini]|uniref:LAGLIDADG homing endonuclease n=1 Tax=Caerostris darwini TaxID=1538125 RepID=A0AAV4P1Z0_9ARAC|nr:hypothetical protein CDAR_559431 [Caerostris darwini]
MLTHFIAKFLKTLKITPVRSPNNRPFTLHEQYIINHGNKSINLCASDTGCTKFLFEFYLNAKPVRYRKGYQCCCSQPLFDADQAEANQIEILKDCVLLSHHLQNGHEHIRSLKKTDLFSALSMMKIIMRSHLSSSEGLKIKY